MTREGGSHRGKEGGSPLKSAGPRRQLWHTLGQPYREYRSKFLGFRVSYSGSKRLLVIHFQLQIRGSGLLIDNQLSNIFKVVFLDCVVGPNQDGFLRIWNLTELCLPGKTKLYQCSSDSPRSVLSYFCTL